ncbi:MAG TPA: hypothetical protein VFF27_10555, partial [Bacteroidia bacterium]|nr:hypothetical protein [Bacteroidia bacterium]
MKNINFKSLLPIAAAVVLFIVISFLFLPPLLKGKTLYQSDMVQNKGMAKEIVDYREKYNEEPLWTNSMFGGMPDYQISIEYPANLVRPIRDIFFLHLPFPASVIFLYMIGFYILLLTLKVDKWLSIIGAIGYGFSSFFIIIITAGHNTQAIALGFMPALFAGVILVCRGRYLLGGVIFTLFTAFEVLANHPQITYYLFLLIGVYVLFEFIERIKQKQFKEIAKMLATFVIGVGLALATNITNLWCTYTYGNASIRGPSELTSELHNKTSGLDRDYVVQWSMGKSETLSLLIPGFKGRSDGLQIADNKEVMKTIDPQMREVVGNMPQYWGDQPTTSSPYSGAILVFLFVFGLFVVRGKLKWVLLIISILSVCLSWGKNMMWFTNIFLDYFPLYNKFRSVSMALVLAEFAIPILAILAVDKVIKTPDFFKQKIKLAFTQKEITVQNAFFISFGLTGGLSLLFYLFPEGLTSFTWIRDTEIFDSYAKQSGNEAAQQIISSLEDARIAIFKGEAIRSFLFITGAGIAVWLFSNAKINKNILIPVLGILILFDLTVVDKSFMNDKNFTNKQKVTTPFPETVADKAILDDKDPNYRVFDLTDENGPFNSARASFYHKSIGGYHAAKLRRYQELKDHQMDKNIQNISNAFRSNPTESSIDSMFAQQGVLNMLNMRYLIFNPEAAPLKNKHALGNAWFVKEVKVVNNADEELKTVGEINPANTVVVDKRYETELTGFTPKPDPAASIKLTDYKANDLKYESNAATEQMAVFSEIY